MEYCLFLLLAGWSVDIYQINVFVCGSQAECDELAQRAEVLNVENASLRAELSRIKSEYEKALSENAALKVIFNMFWYLDFVYSA
jgi:hypothetical protein